MIKINLLDYRTERIRSAIQVQIVASLALVIVVLGISGFLSALQGKEIAALNDNIAGKNRELKSLEHIEKKVAQSEKTQKRLDNIIETINNLKKNQKEPARLYDELLNKLLPPNEMWLQRLEEKPGSIVLRGYAFKDSAISHFMKSLENMGRFSTVNLEYVRQKKMDKRKVKDFKINCIFAEPNE